MRVTTEEYALDSYQNLLFAIARFHEVTGGWPRKITVVGYGMKRRRRVTIFYGCGVGLMIDSRCYMLELLDGLKIDSNIWE
jgi:hypothetical protein